MRARATIEETRSGEQIVVTELPYQASSRAIQERIAELVNSRELEGIRDIQDLSAGNDTKIVIPLKRDANANVVLNNLFKLTPLQTSFGVNMVALVNGGPSHPHVEVGPRGVRRPPGRRRAPAQRVPPPAGQGQGPHRRRAHQGPGHDRRHHHGHPGVRQPG